MSISLQGNDDRDFLVLLAPHVLENGKPTIPSRIDVNTSPLFVRMIRRVWKITGYTPQQQSRIVGPLGAWGLAVFEVTAVEDPVWVRALLTAAFVWYGFFLSHNTRRLHDIAQHVLDNRLTINDVRLIEREREARMGRLFVWMYSLCVIPTHLANGEFPRAFLMWTLVLYSSYANVCFSKPGTKISERARVLGRKITTQVKAILPVPAPVPSPI